MKRAARYLMRLGAVALVAFLATRATHLGPSPVPGGLPETAWPSPGDVVAVLATVVALLVGSFLPALNDYDRWGGPWLG